MKNHRSNFSGINNILKASVCAGALMAMMGGVAYGQFGGVARVRKPPTAVAGV